MTTTTRRVAANLRAEVARQGLTQTALASRLNMSQQAVSRRLSGRHGLTVDDLQAFSEALDLPIEQLIADQSAKAGSAA